MGDAETGRAQDGVSISTIGGLIYVSWTVIFVSLIILLYLLQLSSGCGLACDHWTLIVTNPAHCSKIL